MQSKNAGIAILLNMFWPGAGRIYAGYVVWGVIEMILAPFLILFVSLVTLGFGLLILYPLFVLDGYYAAKAGSAKRVSKRGSAPRVRRAKDKWAELAADDSDA